MPVYPDLPCSDLRGCSRRKNVSHGVLRRSDSISVRSAIYCPPLGGRHRLRRTLTVGKLVLRCNRDEPVVVPELKVTFRRDP